MRAANVPEPLAEGAVWLLDELDHHVLGHRFYGVCTFIGNMMERLNVNRVTSSKCPACGEMLMCTPINRQGAITGPAKCLWCNHIEPQQTTPTAISLSPNDRVYTSRHDLEVIT